MKALTQEEQFAEWMRAYSAVAIKTARAFERSADAQADLLQEILLQWWQSIQHFPPEAHPKPWLYRVSLHVALTWQRRESRRSRLIDRHAVFSDLVEETARPDEGYQSPELLAELYSAIQQLKPTDRALLVLHLDGLTYAEIASTLGISENAVGSRLTRTRDRLEKHLKANRNYEHV